MYRISMPDGRVSDCDAITAVRYLMVGGILLPWSPHEHVTQGQALNPSEPACFVPRGLQNGSGRHPGDAEGGRVPEGSARVADQRPRVVGVKSIDVVDISFGLVVLIVVLMLRDAMIATLVVMLWSVVNTVIIKSRLLCYKAVEQDQSCIEALFEKHWRGLFSDDTEDPMGETMARITQAELTSAMTDAAINTIPSMKQES